MPWKVCQMQLNIIGVYKRFNINHFREECKCLLAVTSRHQITFEVQYLKYDGPMNVSRRVSNSCTKYRSPTHAEVCVTRVTALQHKMEWESSSLRCTRVSSLRATVSA